MRPEQTSTTRLRAVCFNCGTVAYFDSFDQAFAEGWDTIDRFGYNACNNCPGASVFLPLFAAERARNTSDPQKRAQLLAEAAEFTLSFDPGGDGAGWEDWQAYLARGKKQRDR